MKKQVSKCKKYTINMPLKSHLTCYFKNFLITILMPLMISAFLAYRLFRLVSEAFSLPTFIILFILLSSTNYLELIRITVNPLEKTIKIKENIKDVHSITYEHLKNIYYISTEEEFAKILNNSKEIIKTSMPDHRQQNVICIELDNDKVILLSVKKHAELYNSLKTPEMN